MTDLYMHSDSLVDIRVGRVWLGGSDITGHWTALNEKVDLEMIIGWGGVGKRCNPTLNLVLKQT